MLNLILHLILIQITTVFIIDLSGIIDELKHWIWKKWIKVGDYHRISFKPITCSLCMTWWLCLLYLIITHQLTLLTIAITALIAYLSSTTGDFLIWIRDLLTKLITLLYKLIGQ